MNNADKPAYPTQTHTYPDDIDGGESIDGYWGLTKRERLAMAAMQGMLGMEYLNQHFRGNEFEQNGIPKEAVKLADNLLKQLEDTNE